MPENKEYEIWEQGLGGQEPRSMGKYTAESFDDAVKEMLKKRPHLKDLYREDGGRHFLSTFQLFPTKEQAA